MNVEGNCPVQGYEIRDGWLLYFRARDGWSLEAWPPGKWTEQEPGEWRNAAETSVVRALSLRYASSPDVEIASITIDDSMEDRDGFPVMLGENDYPGWWSHEYASKVAEWAITQVPGLVANP